MTDEIRYMLRGQRPLDAMSLVRIPLAVVVLVVVTGVLAVLGMRLTLVLGITSKLVDQLLAIVAFGVGFYAARRAVALVRSRPSSLVVVSASEVRYATPQRGEHRFPNEDVELVSTGIAHIVFRQGGEEHSLPIEGELVGSNDAWPHRLGVRDGRLVVTRVRPLPDGAETDVLPFE